MPFLITGTSGVVCVCGSVSEGFLVNFCVWHFCASGGNVVFVEENAKCIFSLRCMGKHTRGGKYHFPNFSEPLGVNLRSESGCLVIK